MDSQILAVFAALGAALEPAIETQIGKVPQQYRWLMPVILGAVGASFQAFMAGTPWQNAVANGIAFAAAAMVKHDYAPAGNGLPAATPPQLASTAPSAAPVLQAAAIVGNLLQATQSSAAALQITPGLAAAQANHNTNMQQLNAATNALTALTAAVAATKAGA